ncbi:uncharacterized protein [Drosophila takahashii]|uniref:uncharacterized protein n=1 Tax=Drosophila takahashii TaxID=29030 RepID=UPI001CF8D8B2|nr:uncharacterized protein LOC108057624 [Drosophila takahashii]
MANQLVNGNDFVHITADQDDFIDVLDFKEEPLMISEEDMSSHASEIEGDMPPGEELQGIEGGLAVLVAAIETFKTQDGYISGDHFTPEPVEPAGEIAEEIETGFFERHGDHLQQNDNTYNVISSECFSHPSEEVSQMTQLIRFQNETIVYQSYSPPSIPNSHVCHCRHNHSRILEDDCEIDMMEVACILLNSAAAQMSPPVQVDEDTVRTIADGLTSATDFTAGEGIPLIGRQGVGRLVAAIILERESGILLAYAVAQLVPQALIDGITGDVTGMMLHQVTRGFGVNDNYRRIITDNSGPVLLLVNQIPN